MLTIVHGEHTARSRLRLSEILADYTKQGIEIVRIEAKNLTLVDLEQALGSSSLFGATTVLCLEGLLSLPVSARKKQLTEYLHTFIQSQSEEHLVLWEGKQLTAAALKPWSSAKIEEFKVSKQLFTWLETISPAPATKKKQFQLLHQALSTDDAYFCFSMLIRQLRLLIQIKGGDTPAGAPFIVAKLKKQASTFSLNALLELYERLLNIDRAQKTSTSRLSLAQELDLWLLAV